MSAAVIIYINGVGNSPDDARENCSRLVAALGSWQLGTHQVELFYNRTASATGCTVGPRNLTGSSAWDPLCAADAQLPDLLEAAKQIRNVAEDFPRSSQPDAIRLAQAINHWLAQGRRVVLVAHSQGNLMVQEALFGREGIVPRTNWADLAWLSVAAPYLESMPEIGDFHAVILGLDILQLGGLAQQAGSAVASRPMTRTLVKPILFWREVDRAPRTRLSNLTEPMIAEELQGPLRTHAFSNYLNDGASAASIATALRRMLGSPGVQLQRGQKVLLVLDLSGSMNQRGKLDAAKNAAFAALDRIPPSTTVDLVAFGGSCGVSLSAGFNANRDSARQAIANLSASGETPLADAINEVTQRVLASGNPGAFHVIVISDGEETCGGNWERAARRLGEALELVRIP